jgi:hypothetical protein
MIPRALPRPFHAVALVAGLLVVLAPASPAAHDIAIDVAVQAFLKPEGQRLRLLVRAPLRAMLDVEYPTVNGGFLHLRRADPAIREAAMTWIGSAVAVYEEETRLPAPRIVAARVSLESDQSFKTYDEALAHATGPPLPPDTAVLWNQSLLDVLFEYPIQSDRSRFSIEPNLARLGWRVTTVLRFLPPGGAERVLNLSSEPGLVRLDPRWHQAALRFVELGFFHILDGPDHLLFLLCLVIPFRRFKPLVIVVTAFTVAHSVTLIASAYGIAPGASWFPPLIETLIATSIVYMAFENMIAVQLARRWILTFAFGLVHGFGFSFALSETLQLAGSHLLTSLVSFNLGVELGQLLVLAVLIPALELLFRFVVAERMGTIILSALVAHTGWHWMTERGAVLAAYPFPTLDAATVASGMRWLMAAVALMGLAWLASLFLGRRGGSPAGRDAPLTARK